MRSRLNEGTPYRGPVLFTAVTAIVGLLATLVASLLPILTTGYLRPEMHIALDSGEAAAASLVAYLFIGRFRHRRDRRDLEIAIALALIAAGALCFSVLPATTGLGDSSALWMLMAARATGAAIFARAALLGPTTVDRSDRSSLWSLLIVPLLVVLILVGVTIFRDALPDSGPEAGVLLDRLRLGDIGAVRWVQFVVMNLYLIAAVGFTRRALVQDDKLLPWVGAGSALASLARFNYFIYPSLYTDLIYMGDALRLGFYVFLLIGAAREIGDYWENYARAAVLEERRRLSRDLHDGIAQELVFISAQARRLALGKVEDTQQGLGQLNSAAERAVGETRRAMAVLTRPMDQSLDDAVSELVETVSIGRDETFRLELQRGVRIEPRIREALYRIVREALSNAMKHAQAGTIQISLEAADELCLEVTDDGVGFDPTRPPDGGGFGLISMEEGARRIGGRLEVRSAPGEGTSIKLTRPTP